MPRLNFTVRGIETIAPASTRLDYWDENTPGFGLRVSEQGRKSWIVMYRHHRQLRRMTIGTYPTMGLADARDLAKEILVEGTKGNDPARKKQQERDAGTVADLAKEYMERHAKVKKKSWETDERVLGTDFLPDLGSLKAKDISRKDILRILDRISDRGSPIMANKSLGIIRKMFNFGVQRDIVPVQPLLEGFPPTQGE